MDIYIGSIPFKWKDKNLMDLFEPYGEVSAVKIIIDKITCQNKGFGFVTMPDEISAQKAINALNGLEIDGRTINVNQSLPKVDIQKPQRKSTKTTTQQEFKSDKHKKSLPPWLRKEY